LNPLKLKPKLSNAVGLKPIFNENNKPIDSKNPSQPDSENEREKTNKK